mmetsp:Transcript_48491/g.125819  ORF Transcript_48491/g.125819 Transcript_48491/m.125819 type:complete len:108 (+) Transcript_48491:179-502(+)
MHTLLKVYLFPLYRRHLVTLSTLPTLSPPAFVTFFVHLAWFSYALPRVNQLLLPVRCLLQLSDRTTSKRTKPVLMVSRAESGGSLPTASKRGRDASVQTLNRRDTKI